MFQNYRLVRVLCQTDVWVKDKQNVDPALRLLYPPLRSCLLNFDDNETFATRVYLKIGQKMHNAYACNNLTIAERIEEACMPGVFLRLWRQWLKIEKYEVNSMIISGNSLILAVKVFAKYYREAPFVPLLFGSNQCEKLFAKIQCFQKMKTNVALIEMIDICGRLRKLSEKHALCEQNQTAITLPKRSKGAKDQLESNYVFPHWPDDVEDTITRSMKTIKAKALETIKLLGMDHSLLQENILEESSGVLQVNGNFEVVNNETELLSSGDSRDENKILDHDDIESLSAEDTLATVLLNNREQATRNDLIDIAASTRQVTSVSSES